MFFRKLRRLLLSPVLLCMYQYNARIDSGYEKEPSCLLSQIRYLLYLALHPYSLACFAMAYRLDWRMMLWQLMSRHRFVYAHVWRCSRVIDLSYES